jgi:hypothetical protein
VDSPALDLPAKFTRPVFLSAGHEDLSALLSDLVEQGEKGGATLDIEFAHDIIDQKDGSGAVDVRQVFRLGDLQGDGQGPFLAFATILGSGSVLDGQAEIITMGADKGGAECEFAPGRLGEFNGEVGFYGWEIVEGELFETAGDAAEGLTGKRCKARDQIVSEADDFRAGGDELAGESFECSWIMLALFEQGVAGAQGAHITLEQGQVGGVGLGQKQVEKPASAWGGPFDELQVLGAEYHCAEDAPEIAQASHGLLVEGQAAFGCGPIDPNVMLDVGDHGGIDEVSTLTFPHEVRTAHASEGAESGDKINGLEQVGLALCVVSKQEMKARRKNRIEPRIIPEITQSQSA